MRTRLHRGISRQIPEGAALGVHAPLQAEPIAKSRRLTAAIEERNRVERRQYIKQMGVDPELVEFGDRTPHQHAYADPK